MSLRAILAGAVGLGLLAFGAALATAQTDPDPSLTIESPEPSLEPSLELQLPTEQVETPQPMGPAEAPERFVEANASYESGDYPRAIELYTSLVENGFDSGYLYYNLGNAYLRNGELGRAIASYRRSRARLPRDEDVAANLDFARNTAVDALAPPRPNALSKTLLFWHHGLSSRELKWAALVLNVLFWTVLFLRLVRRRSEFLRWTTFFLLVPLVACLGSLAIRWLDPQRVAVVVPQEINAVSGPGEDAVIRFKLHAGTEVAVRDQRDGWLRIALPDGQQGWIESDYAEVVVG